MAVRLDEDALNDEEALAQRDHGDLLRALAGSGAQVRRALGADPEWLMRLRDTGGRPRTVLVAADEPGSGLADLLAALSDDAPVVAISGGALPRWAGPGDALLAASREGADLELSGLVGQAGQRGMMMAVAAPAGSPLAYAAAGGRGAIAPIAEGLAPRASFWSLATPLLQALDALGAAIVPAGPLAAAADALDDAALACRASADSLDNQAKLLAIELGESDAVLAGSGRLGVAAAREFATQLALLAGQGAALGALPRDASLLAAALVPAPDEESDDEVDDFFRDRVEDAPQRARLVFASLVDDDQRAAAAQQRPLIDGFDGASEDASRARSALLGLAGRYGVRASELAWHGELPLARYASAALFGQFAAAYLALGRGIDPGAPIIGPLADARGGRW
jgi:hypothetical protein